LTFKTFYSIEVQSAEEYEQGPGKLPKLYSFHSQSQNQSSFENKGHGDHAEIKDQSSSPE